MFCDKCGAQLRDGDNFCHACGRSFSAAAAPAAPRPGTTGRVARNLTILGVLWIVYSVLKIVPAFAAFGLGTHLFHFADLRDVPVFGGPVLAAFGGLTGLLAILGIVAGIALLSYRASARVFLLVLAFLSLLSIPFGTALGIYTIWVLLPGESEAELREMARARRGG
jgi:hypothetical protein